MTSLFSLQYQELYARKPKEGEEDPVLVEEIRKARENVGMYTRKTSIEYEELDPIRFNNHKSQLIMLLQQVIEECIRFKALRWFMIGHFTMNK